jgi:single-strand DNA-binding protein
MVGRLTRDAELKHVGETDLAEFSVAVNERVKENGEWTERASFFDVTKWKPGGLARYLTKGQQVAIHGRPRQDRWEKDGQKRSKVRVTAFEVELIGSRGDGGGQAAGGQGGAPDPDDLPDDDIPF